VRLAADADEAIEQARALRPDVVVMDLHLPEVSGLAAAGRRKPAAHSR
jgi:CheY-like chemotaxis protein